MHAGCLDLVLTFMKRPIKIRVGPEVKPAPITKSCSDLIMRRLRINEHLEETRTSDKTPFYFIRWPTDSYQYAVCSLAV